MIEVGPLCKFIDLNGLKIVIYDGKYVHSFTYELETLKEDFEVNS